jgi:amino acid adenylation domain-containing protein
MIGAHVPELSGTYMSALDGSVAAAFERAAALHAGSIAVGADSETLTYAAINRAANRLAHAIIARRGAGEEPVAFVADRPSVELTCLLAILKAGKAYVALDPAHPSSRLQAVCADVQPGLILTTARCRAVVDRLALEPSACLDVDAPGVGLPDHNLELSIPPSRLAAIYFTSGSSGQPKGVCYDQRGLLHRIFTTVLCSEMRPGDRQALHLRCDTSWSVTIIFSALLAGATLYPIDVSSSGVSDMAEWVARQGITHFPMTCSLYRQWVDALPAADDERYPSLRFLNVAAEPLLRRDVEQFRRHFPARCVLFHSLATSECGRIACSKIVRTTPLPEERVAAGYPDLDKEILIVGEDGRWAAPGETGEICVRTRYTMSGYWRKPKLTAAVLRPDPDGSDRRIYFSGDLGRIGRDGQLEVFGRRDFQAKVRGFRVQPAEVEMHLLNLKTISEAVVVALTEPGGDTRLVAYLVAQGETTPSVAELRAALAQTLPGYMIPSAFIFLPTLPLNPAGKVDRQALPRPSPGRPSLETAYVAPRNALEARLVSIWEEVLPVAPIGVDDDFLNLGGDSLLAFSVISHVLKDFDVKLTPLDLFACNSVGAMAALIAELQRVLDGKARL